MLLRSSPLRSSADSLVSSNSLSKNDVSEAGLITLISLINSIRFCSMPVPAESMTLPCRMGSLFDGKSTAVAACVCVDGCYRLTSKSVFLASVNDRAGSSDSHSSRVSVSPTSSCLRARVDWQSSQCSRVCASSSHDGQLGLTLGSIRLAYALRCLECPARNWASKVASALDFT